MILIIDSTWDLIKSEIKRIVKWFIGKPEIVHNPYFDFLADDLYEKYSVMGEINVTGAALEEMAGVRDVQGKILDLDVIELAHQIGGRYDLALEAAKEQLYAPVV